MKRHALVFPGQGSQHSGMLDRVPQTDGLERLLDAAEALSGVPLSRVLHTGGASDLADTRIAQPLLFLADWAWGTAALEVGLRPIAVAGHSLGELAALAIAGVFSVEAGIELVTERAALMATAAGAAHGGMAAVLGAERETVYAVVGDLAGVWVANDNSPVQVVLSGTSAGIESATRALTGAGARKIVDLSVGGPFHSPLMQSAANAFADVLDATAFADAVIPVVQNTRPEPTTDAREIRARLREQIVSPVRWTETMASLAEMGAEVLVECGPGSVLTELARRHESLTAVSLDDAGLEGAMEVLR